MASAKGSGRGQNGFRPDSKVQPPQPPTANAEGMPLRIRIPTRLRTRLGEQYKAMMDTQKEFEATYQDVVNMAAEMHDLDEETIKSRYHLGNLDEGFTLIPAPAPVPESPGEEVEGVTGDAPEPVPAS